MRIRVDLAYDGAGFHGWARQPGLRTVQGELEAALATIWRIPEVSVTCAGRTDTGVHARGQVVHVDVDESLVEDQDRLVRRLNGVLDPDVRVRDVRVAAPGFDARFSALWRRYAYRIADTAARTLGTRVAWHVFTHALRPVQRDFDWDHHGGDSDRRDDEWSDRDSKHGH